MTDTPAWAQQRQLRLSTDTLLAGGRAIGVATLAGMGAGILVAGVAGRLAMRLSGFMFLRDNPGAIATTDNGNRVGAITLGGTLIVLFLGLALGTMGAYFYAGLKPWLPGNAAARGLLFGLFMLLLASMLSLDPHNVDFERFGSARVNTLLFSALFLAYGMAIAPLEAWLDRRIPRRLGTRGQRWDARTAMSQASLIGSMAAGIFAVQLLMGFLVVVSVGGDHLSQQLQPWLIIAYVPILLLAYVLLLPAVQERGYRSVLTEHRAIATGIGGGALLVLAACAAFTIDAMLTLV